MRTSAKVADQRIDRITFDEETMSVALMDGRVITLPLGWYPRLLGATPEQRRNYRIETPGDCVHWPDVDEDLHVNGMLKGVPAPGHRAPRRARGDR
ncbi:MAG: DUF2442 domain-containing protein [Geminicoccales bacterium]